MVNVQSIILCAGVSSRLKSSKSKILHEICGRPLGYWPIKNALATTNLKPIVVVSHQAEAIEEKLRGYFQDKIEFAHQKIPDGTAGAVKAALPLIDKSCHSILVVCGDTPLLKIESLQKLIAIQTGSHGPIAMLTAFTEDPLGYGRIVRNSAQQIAKIVECKEASPLEREIKEVNPSVYVFDAVFLHEYIDKIEAHRTRKEFYLTDLVHFYVKSDPKHEPICSIEIPYEEMHGTNDRKQLAYAQKVLNKRLLENSMLDGVTFIDPDTTYIEEGVRLAKDVTIYPGVHLQGETHVGEGVIIENGAIIKDTVIEKDAHILPYTCCDQAHIGERALVGPFARLRPHTHLEQDVKVGNFVEIKQSRLKKGAKAGHLAYLGDAEIGSHTNIGAGTITCNYDGQHKHKTFIGNDSFVGSHATLIAPLVVGDNSYIAGGSVITKEVPKGSLGIGRAHQVNKERKKT